MRITTVVIGITFVGLFLTSAAQPVAAQSGQRLMSLDTAIRRAVIAAPSLRSRTEEITGSIAAIRQAGVKPNPEIDLDLEDILGSGDFSGFESSQTTLGIGKRFERGGKRQARVSLAESTRDIAELKWQRTRLDVIFAAQKAYVEVMAASAKYVNAQNRYRLAADLEKAVLKRVNAALDSEAAAQRIAIQKLEAQTNLDQAQRAVARAKRQLSMLWGSRSTNYSVDARQLYRIKAIGPLVNGVPPESIPDIALTMASKSKADAAIALEVARSKQDPTVKMGIRHFAETDDVAAIVSFSMPLALFDTNRNNIDRAVAEREKVDWDAVDIRSRYHRRVATLVDTISAAKSEALTIRGNVIPRAKKSLGSVRRGYERSAFTYLEVLEAQRTLRDLQAREILALTKFHMNKAELDRMTARHSAQFPGEVSFK